jgi:hypothetical protein
MFSTTISSPTSRSGPCTTSSIRRHLGPDYYLELLRFYLNHHRFPRSERPERAGKSPAEILAGRTLPHWMEQLGFSLYRGNAEAKHEAT